VIRRLMLAVGVAIAFMATATPPALADPAGPTHFESTVDRIEPDASSTADDGAPDGDLGARRVVLHRIPHEVHHRLGQTLLVGDDHRLGSLVHGPGPTAERGTPGGEIGRQLGEIEGMGVHEVRLLRPSQHEEVVDDAGHAAELIADDGQRLLPVGVVVAHHLEIAPDDGDGRPQLVPGVVDEAALGGERILIRRSC
jgi:hypothetical protein